MSVKRHRITVTKTDMGGRHAWAWTAEWLCHDKWLVEGNGYARTRARAITRARCKAHTLLTHRDPLHYEEHISYNVKEHVPEPDLVPLVANRLGCPQS